MDLAVDELLRLAEMRDDEHMWEKGLQKLEELVDVLHVLLVQYRDALVNHHQIAAWLP